MPDSSSSRPAGGVEDRELLSQRVATLCVEYDDVPSHAVPIEALKEALAGSAGDADHLTARECKLVVSGFEKDRNMEELTNAEDMALVRLDRLAGEGL